MVVLDDVIFGKPKSIESACVQLQKMQGRTHQLLTGVALVSGSQELTFLNVCQMTLRPLTQTEIENYIRLDLPLDCAGSYKIEKSGISLFEKIECEDWTAIQGLPILRLTSELVKLGFTIPGGSA